ncbi:TIGR02391 family protein [Roseibium aggregatum]|uniref:TIGR02391 family protein n=1 Tax=Roseibium aggregatum TaxID=187304 RepID=A0A926P323_9HYPH|nr:TIGR02391 family protein [Roseibium aggregatum]MBD1548218.1 TIGR02391 family protein [Roseibium aggregatum]
MWQLPKTVPDPEVLISLEPEELASIMLFLLREAKGREKFHPYNLAGEVWGNGTAAHPKYDRAFEEDINLAISEAWAWLEAQALIVPVPGINGQNGWRVLSRRAHRFENPEEFKNYSIARGLSKETLNRRIANSVWMSFMRGEYDTAVFQAMKAVEVAVREASGLTDMIGVPLMRKAFDKTAGPLTDLTMEEAEREMRAHLFAGAIGSFKNPHSHKDIELDNPAEAFEIIMLANLLLRIVDARIEEVGIAS